MRLAYADPPYLGCCKRYDHEHNDGGGLPWDGMCWDEVLPHRLLIEYLNTHDGWAYSMTSQSLGRILASIPADIPYRTAAWVKPFAAFKRGVRIAYSWEPVLFKPGRDRSADGAPVGRDHLSVSITLQRGFMGAKPAKFNRWMLDLMGYVEGDDVADLFPGTGGMGATIREAVLM